MQVVLGGLSRLPFLAKVVPFKAKVEQDIVSIEKVVNSCGTWLVSRGGIERLRAVGHTVRRGHTAKPDDHVVSALKSSVLKTKDIRGRRGFSVNFLNVRV